MPGKVGCEFRPQYCPRVMWRKVCEENSDHDVDDNDSNGDDNDADNNDDDKIIIARNRQIMHMCFKLLISGEIGCITT